MLIAVLCVTLANTWLSARQTRGHVEQQLREVAQTLVESTFPLTDAVLRQTRGLSGAEFVVVDVQNRVVATSLNDRRFQPEPGHPQEPTKLQLGEIVSIGADRYFHLVVRRASRPGGGQEQRVHLFYPEEQWRRAWRNAVAPPLIVGIGALGVMAFVTTWLANRLTRPIGSLRSQVERIAQGDLKPLPLPGRDDEIRDLAAAVNRMAETLARYEDEIRRRERLRTLGQLGAGIAHQMRNAATGCRLALDFFRRGNPDANSDENLVVALRQLELMETYLRRFLTLGSEFHAPSTVLDAAQVVEDVLPLVRPTAAHLGVELRWTRPSTPFLLRGDENGLAQLVVNLALNAIEAAASNPRPKPPNANVAAGEEKPPSLAQDFSAFLIDKPLVEVRLFADTDNTMATFEIVDNGPGPHASVQGRLFEPLVTDKPDGAGLGLPVAREIAQLHQGDITWVRKEGHTHFVVLLPLLSQEEQRAEIVGR